MKPSSPVRYLARLLVTTAVGATLAGAFVVGTSAGTHDPPSEPQSRTELRLGAYCRRLFGERADAYQPRDLEAWRCSAWRNGVWGLEEVDLPAACRWQAGPAAKLESGGDRVEGGRADGGTGHDGTNPSEAITPRLACTS